jgi:isopentenyldiphosphate isomerase
MVVPGKDEYPIREGMRRGFSLHVADEQGELLIVRYAIGFPRAEGIIE